jgi:ribosomal-protein-alanine N-acetyltransferase
MEVVIETKRTLMRKFTMDDAALLFALNGDLEVTRYTLDAVQNMEEAKQILETSILPQYALYNHGRWAVLVKPNLEFIGWCGLKRREEEIDLGYRFIQKSWGKGYATETAYASIRYGFNSLQMKEIVGRALPDNLASLRVLEKCGMIYKGEEMVDGLLHKTYDIKNRTA